MSETIVAPAKRWIELHTDLIPIDGSQFKEVQCSDAHLEEIMIRFAQAHVQKALEAVKDSAYCNMYSELVEESVTEAYPIENVK